MERTLRTIVLGAVMVIAATGCNGDEPAGGSDVTIRDNSFDPGALTVAAGSDVTWTHDGAVTHNVTFAGSESSDQLSAGDTFTRSFDEPGTFDYVCTLHQGMSGSITVE